MESQDARVRRSSLLARAASLQPSSGHPAALQRTRQLQTAPSQLHWRLQETAGSWVLLALLLTDDCELLDALAPVLGDINAALRVDGDAVRLIELARVMAHAAEARQDLPGLTLDDLDLRIVLIDDVQQPLIRIVR